MTGTPSFTLLCGFVDSSHYQLTGPLEFGLMMPFYHFCRCRSSVGPGPEGTRETIPSGQQCGILGEDY